MLTFFRLVKTNNSIKKAVLCSTLLFLSLSIIIINYTYLNALFLSVYDKKLLPFLYLSQSIVMILFLSLSSFVKKTENNRYFASLFWILMAFILIFLPLLQLKIVWIPFVFCSLLLSFESLIESAAWVVVMASYDIREFKTIGKRLNIVASLGGVFGGLIASGIVNFFSVQALAYFNIAALLVCGMLTLYINRIPEIKPLSVSRNRKINSYPLVRKISLYFLISMMFYVLLDYLLKAKLSVTYNEVGIAKFLSYFFTSTAVLTVLVQFIGTKKLVSKYGPPSLLSIMPVFVLIFAVGVLIYPGSLVLVTLLASIWYIFDYSYTNLGIQLTSNALPTQARQTTKFFLESVIFPTGIGLGSLFLLASETLVGSRLIALIVITGALFLLYFLRFIIRDYVNTLKESIVLQQLEDDITEYPEHIKDLLKKIGLISLRRKSNSLRLFGLSLFAKLLPKKLPKKVIDCLFSDDETTQLATIDLIARTLDKKGIIALKQLLRTETKETIIGHALAALAKSRVNLSREMIHDYLSQTSAPIRFGAIVYLITKGNPEELSQAFHVLDKMVYSKKVEMRLYAAYVIKNLHIGDFTQTLENLIRDKNPEVSIAAMQAIIHKKSNARLIHAFIDQLSIPEKSYQAIQNLAAMGKSILPYIENRLTVIQDFFVIQNVIKLLISINEKQAFELLWRLYDKHQIIHQKTIAYTLAVQSIKHPAKLIVKNKALYYIRQHIKIVEDLYHCLQSCNKKSLLREIKARIEVLKEISLYWFAVMTHPYEVMQLIPLFLDGPSHEKHNVLVASAIELLDSFAKKPDLKQLVLLLEKPILVVKQKAQPLSLESIKNKKIPDEWLIRVGTYLLDKHDVSILDEIQRVFILRKNDLFRPLLAEYLLFVAKNMVVVNYQANDIIFRQGTRHPNGMYIVVSGQVQIIKNRQVVATLKASDEFGEMALLNPKKKRAATAKATTDVVLLHLDQETFDQITNEIPAFLRAIIRLILHYLRQSLTKGL